MKYNAAKISDKIEQYYNTGNVATSQFMNPFEIVQINNLLNNVENVIWGGYENAERKVVFIGDAEPNFDEFFSVIRITSNEKLLHRNVLGSIIGLGLKRDVIGDLLIKHNSCDVIVMKSVAEFIINNLTYVDKEKVTVSEVKLDELLEPKDSSKVIEASVKSLRVDAVICAGFGMSRNASNDLVKKEGVRVNFVPTNSPMQSVGVGDVISVRGKGRIVITEIGDKTRRDRTKVTIVRR